MARRFMAGNQTRLLMRLDESSAITPVHYGYVKPTTNVTGTLSPVAVSGMHFDYARRFDGSTTRIELVDTADFNYIGGGCWFKVSSMPAVTQYLIQKAGAYLLRISGAGIIAGARDSTGTWHYSSTYDFTSLVNTWIYAHFTYDGYYVILYINGVEVGRSAIAAGNTVKAVSVNAYVGAHSTATSYFAGDLAEVIIHPDPVFPHEIYEIYNSTRTDPTLGFEVEDDSIAVYNFDSDAAGVIVDDAGNHNGSIVGALTTITNAPFGTPRGAKGYLFPGAIGNYISIPHHTDFDIGATKGLTVEILCETSSKTTAQDIVGKLGTSSDLRNGWSLHLNTSIVTEFLLGYIADSSGSDGDSTGAIHYIQNDRPMYLCFSIDGPSRRTFTYANGHYSSSIGAAELTTIEGLTWSQVSNTQPLVIGQRLGATPKNPWRGSIYAVRFTSRAKTALDFERFLTGANLSR